MSPPTDLDLALLLNRVGQRIAEQRVTPIATAYGRGYIAAIDGQVASVSKGIIGATATPGFTIPVDGTWQVGDYVWFYELGSDRILVRNLSQGSTVPPPVPSAPIPANVLVDHVGAVVEDHLGGFLWDSAGFVATGTVFSWVSGDGSVHGTYVWNGTTWALQ